MAAAAGAGAAAAGGGAAAAGAPSFDLLATDNPGRQAEGIVLIKSEDMPAGTPVCAGPDFNSPALSGPALDAFAASLRTMGFQATNVALAMDEINKMLDWRLSDEPVKESDDDDAKDPAKRAATKCTIFLGMTSNMVSCGMREVVRYLAQHRLVDAIVTSAGAVEEDIMKCLRPHYMGDFNLPGPELRKKGINRIGNLLVPNLNYVAFEEWVMPVLAAMHDEQDKGKKVWSPSAIIERFGQVINDESSVWYWCAKNGIPVFCPGLTDGSVGDMLYFHLWQRSGFIVDIAQDIRRLNDLALKAPKSGIIILGGGLIKHHICNANLMRNGADYAVFINTASDYDGSDTGARPDEAVSWGKIKLTATPVKVYADATLVFPLIVSQTFAKYVQRGQTPALKAGGGGGAAGGDGAAPKA
jgi:deoxyhypusine synthase